MSKTTFAMRYKHMGKRILVFSLAYFPKHIGGAEIAIKEITDRMSANEIEFHMVTNRYDSTLPREERIGNVLVHRIGITVRNPNAADLRTWPLHFNKFLFQFLAAWKALRLHRTYRYDGMWAVMAHSCGVPAAIFKMVHPEVPYVLTLQEGDPIDHIEKKMRPLWPLFTQAFTRADMVHAISTFLVRWARARGFDGPIEVIPNAVDTAHFSQTYTPDEMRVVQERIGKKEGDIFLITTSRLVTKNAVDDVIRALPKLAKHVHFAILGTGPDEGALRTLARELNVEDRTHFLGFVDHAEMPKYLKACDIFVRPSRSEGMGNSFVEAMAAEVPVIATQEGGIIDFLFDEKRNPDKRPTGWAVDANAPEQIAKAVEDIVGHPEKRAQVQQSAKRLALAKYDWNVTARDMREKVFQPLLG